MIDNDHKEKALPPTKGFSRKTIVQTIERKVNHWCKQIEKDWDEEKHGSKEKCEKLIADIKSHYICTGGAITSMLQGYLPNDFDLYFDDVNTTVDVVNHYLSRLVKEEKVSTIEARPEADANGNSRVNIFIKSAGLAQTEDEDFKEYQYFEMYDPSISDQFLDKDQFKTKKAYGLVMMTTNAISLNNDIQIITRFVGNPEQIHKSFDFVHCTNYYSKATGLVLKAEALESILCKKLSYVGSLYPICSLFRLRKFIKRGWTITAGEVLKIAWDVNKLNLNDIDCLRDQLVGVDSAYFSEVIGKLQEEYKDGKPVERTYLFELINRVFSDDTDSSELINLVDESDENITNDEQR